MPKFQMEIFRMPNTKPPLILLGIPYGHWSSYGAEIAQRANPQAQAEFTSIHDRFFASDSAAQGGQGAVGKASRPAVGDPLHFLASTFQQSAGERMVLADRRACWLGEDLMTLDPKPEILAFYEKPESVLARGSSEQDPFEALGAWEAAAEQLLDLLRRYRAETALVSWEEACSNVEAWNACLREKFGIDPDGLIPTNAPDPVRLLLARQVVADNRKISLLLAELEAASHPLSHTSTHAELDADELLRIAWEKALPATALADAEKERQALQSRVEVLSRENQALEKKAASKQSEMQAKLNAAGEENELLLLQLHQVQEELEHYFLENKLLEKKRLVLEAGAPRMLRVDALRLGPSHDDPPHRHLEFTLEKVRLGERGFASVRMRLVDHNGHPGLLIFQGGSPEAAPLQHWQPNGEEKGHPFLLVVPQDDPGRDFLVAATTSDLLLVKESAHLLSRELQVAADHGNSSSRKKWQRVAQRFGDLLENVPQRAHYDHVVAKFENTACHFEMHHFWTLAKGLVPSLACQWKGNGIDILLAPDSPPPLTGWPNGDADSPCDRLSLDLDPHGDWSRQREIWRAFTAKDQEMLLHFIEEFPNLIHHLVQQNPSLEKNSESLRRNAELLLKRARALARGRRPKRVFGLLPA